MIFLAVHASCPSPLSSVILIRAARFHVQAVFELQRKRKPQTSSGG